MNCEAARQLIAARRELSYAQERMLQDHLAGCARCRMEAKRQERAIGMLRQVTAPQSAVRSATTTTIRARLASELKGSRVGRFQIGAATLVAVVLVVIMATHIGSTGSGLSWPPVQTGVAPSAGTLLADGVKELPSDLTDTLYLVQWLSPREQHLLAYEPRKDTLRFELPFAPPPPYIVKDHGTGQAREVHPRDIVLSPDGRRIYLIEHIDGKPELVARNSTTGNELWRSKLPGGLPHPVVDGKARLLVSPDGAKVFVRITSPNPVASGIPTPPYQTRLPALLPFEAATGMQAGESVDLTFWADTLIPLDATSAVILGGPRGVNRLGFPEGVTEGTLREYVVAGSLLPDGHTIQALTPDLQLLTIDTTDNRLRVDARLDLLPNGTFFFEQAAFTLDGQTLVVGRTAIDMTTNTVQSDIRIFQAGPWREISKHRFPGRLERLALSSTGEIVFASVEPVQPDRSSDRQESSTDGRTLIAFNVVNGQETILGNFSGKVSDILVGQ